MITTMASKERGRLLSVARIADGVHMVTVTVCVGSSCHIKGARDVIMRFHDLLKKHGLEDKVELKGSFCMERCGEGVNWQIDDEPLTSSDVEDAVETFRKRILDPMGIRPANGPKGGAGA